MRKHRRGLAVWTAGDMQQRPKATFSTTRLLIGAVVLFNVLVLYSNVRSFYEDDGRGDSGQQGVPQARFEGHKAAVTPHAGGSGSRQEGKFFHDASAAPGSSSEFAAARQRALQDKQHRALPVLASLLTSESDFRLARRLVGSVHHWHLGLAVQLYLSYDVPAEQLSEARAWQDVVVILPDVLSKDLEPDLSAPAAAALLGGSSAHAAGGGDPWTPWRLAAMLHAAKSSASGSAMYLEPWAVITGWLDHLFKELQRDGALHVCDSSGPSGPRGYASGISLKAAAAMDQLQRQVKCLLLEQQQEEEEEDGPRGPCSHMQPPGPEVRCHRPEAILVEMGSRPRGGGSGDDINDPDSLLSQPEREGGSSALAEDEEGGGRRDREMAKYACLVRLRHLGSGLRAELRAEARTPAPPQPGQKHIALGVPCSTGKQSQSHQHQEQQHLTAPPVIGSLLPSVLATARQQGGRYRYTLLVGFEEGDAMLDDPPQLQELQRSAEQQLSSGDGRVSVALKAFRLPAAGSAAALWNALFDIAADEGADYFMAAHQGTELPVAASAFGGGGGDSQQQQQQLWSDALVQSLLENPMRRNFGVASPMARGRPRSLTHPMVHVQTHRDVFGTMFPDALVLGGGPQGPEKWVSHVYGAHSTFLLTNVAVALPMERSMGGGGGTSSPERACGADVAERAVDFAVEDSSARMREWLEVNGGGEEL